MSAMDDVIGMGMALIHDEGLCPACKVQDRDVRLVRERPANFHYHDDGERTYLFCPEDGQGYRIENDALKILVPCNGGLHPWDVRPTPRRFA